MFTSELLDSVSKIVSVLSPLGLFFTWLLTKRHFQKAEVKQAEASAEEKQADVIVKNLEIYQNMLDDIEKRYEVKLLQRDNEIVFLEGKVKELELRIRKLEK